MKKTKYIKDKNGKFAGSIGIGKTVIPTGAPTGAPSAITPATASQDASSRIAEPFSPENLPNYLLPSGDLETNSIPLHPLPESVTDASELDHESTRQDELDDNIERLLNKARNLLDEDAIVFDQIIGDSHAEEEEDSLGPANDYTPGKGVSKYDSVFPSDDRMLELSADARQTANNLRAAGQLHQAYAYEHAAETIEHVYDLSHPDLKYHNSLDASHWVSTHGAKPSGSTENGLDNAFSVAERRHNQRRCIGECERSFSWSAIEADSKRLRRHAVLRDLLPLTGNDVAAAKVMMTLMNHQEPHPQ